ncbi:DUF2057 family protein [Vibrio cholerae]|nr:DUF2057 family protein [Vibrio cholerae]
MKLLNYLSILFLFALSNSVSAIEYRLAQGVELKVINGEKVENDESPDFKAGMNQLVVKYSGRVRKNSKSEYLSTMPYIVQVRLEKEDTLSISLISDDYKDLVDKQNKGEPIFIVKKNGEFVDDQNLLLAKTNGLFPYSNLVDLVKEYNNEKGIIVDSGTLRDLKEELSTLNLGNNIKNDDSEATLQLKIWYSKATAEERIKFLEWAELAK